MSDVNGLIRNIKSKTKLLIETIGQLENENKQLKLRQQELLQTIDSQKEIINNYEESKTSKIIAESIKQGEGNSDVKKQLDKMVREIDKCIELLNR